MQREVRLRKATPFLGIVLGACIWTGCAAEQSPMAPPSITGKIWLSTDPSAAPGTVRVFLPDGTLLMTSCVETYRIARWVSVAERRIAWNEDTARIEADITALTADELRLRLELRQEVKEEAYRAATDPYVCPDLRR